MCDMVCMDCYYFVNEKTIDRDQLMQDGWCCLYGTESTKDENCCNWYGSCNSWTAGDPQDATNIMIEVADQYGATIIFENDEYYAINKCGDSYYIGDRLDSIEDMIPTIRKVCDID